MTSDDTSLEPESNDELPDADLLAQKAAKISPKVYLKRYIKTLKILEKKGYSYGEIATWMSDELGVKVNRGQVAYALSACAIEAEHNLRDDADAEATSAVLDDETDDASTVNELEKISGNRAAGVFDDGTILRRKDAPEFLMGDDQDEEDIPL